MNTQKTLTDRDKAIYSHVLLYSICYDIDKKTPIVNKWMRQIRLAFIKLNKDYIDKVQTDVHNMWQKARQKVIEKDSKIDVKMSELLMTLYNRIPSEYQNIWYTDKTFTKVVNSFWSCHFNKAEKKEHTDGAWKLADAWLDEIGVDKTNTKLSRLKNTIKNNLIIEGKL